jgi:hypothetical protein
MCEADADLCTNDHCDGNGMCVFESLAGECAPPVTGTEICNDLAEADEDGDNLANCFDAEDCPAFCKTNMDAPDFMMVCSSTITMACTTSADCPATETCKIPCTKHRDCRIALNIFKSPTKGGPVCEGKQICDQNFEFTQCTPMHNDPGEIRFGATPEDPDRFSFHARFPVSRKADPRNETFRVTLANDNGTIYSGTLLPGDFRYVPYRRYYYYTDRTEKKGGQRDGLARVKVKFRTRNGRLWMAFRIRAYGDLSLATEPRMGVQVHLTGTEVGFNQGDWLPTSRGWETDSF